MTPIVFHWRILRPGLASLESLGGPRESAPAARFLLAVALQESRIEWRYQIGKDDMRPGPARGWFQFEVGGGVNGVMTHQASADLVDRLCAYHEIKHNIAAVWRAIEGHDAMSVAMARLLLLTDAHEIPDNEIAGWSCYLRLWRPGKPHQATWPGHWRTASEVCGLPP